ncbi:nucleotidyltransferase family protein [Solirubrobacter phytolaccae]|uniref:Nucleotidyltransferase family protein n=1 Tax=Solirubrobacter phytolaccae TaxID=1404360 RepID=A0A9X3S848_9ACTN|nr:nucleotidyltransferase family protein [Solirubrobacter phytolaccae]MDA0179871.1 nucleotidyltransferase family protein [Solirubrobacter phytolaccae]
MDELWNRVDELADRAPRLSDLRHHKLHLVAASRRRAAGEAIPADLQHDERLAAAILLGAGLLMRRVRAAVPDAQIIVMKGPEAAAYWPQPRMRPWKDLDLLVEDAEAVQTALLAAGFVEVGDPELYEDIHHLRPLALPELPLSIEVHMRPKWPTATPPSFATLAAAARPSTFGLEGVLAPSPAHHAVLLAAHAWEHDPLSRLSALVDVAAVTHAAGEEAAAAVAREWGVSRLWAATWRAVEDVFGSGAPRSAPIWRRHLLEARERTVFEGHVERLVGPVAAAPLPTVPGAAAKAIVNTLRPGPDEGWGEKLTRSRSALRNASLRRSDHLETRRPT